MWNHTESKDSEEYEKISKNLGGVNCDCKDARKKASALLFYIVKDNDSFNDVSSKENDVYLKNLALNYETLCDQEKYPCVFEPAKLSILNMSDDSNYRWRIKNVETAVTQPIDNVFIDIPVTTFQLLKKDQDGDTKFDGNPFVKSYKEVPNMYMSITPAINRGRAFFDDWLEHCGISNLSSPETCLKLWNLLLKFNTFIDADSQSTALFITSLISNRCKMEVSV